MGLVRRRPIDYIRDRLDPLAGQVLSVAEYLDHKDNADPPLDYLGSAYLANPPEIIVPVDYSDRTGDDWPAGNPAIGAVAGARVYVGNDDPVDLGVYGPEIRRMDGDVYLQDNSGIWQRLVGVWTNVLDAEIYLHDDGKQVWRKPEGLWTYVGARAIIKPKFGMVTVYDSEDTASSRTVVESFEGVGLGDGINFDQLLECSMRVQTPVAGDAKEAGDPDPLVHDPDGTGVYFLPAGLKLYAGLQPLEPGPGVVYRSLPSVVFGSVGGSTVSSLSEGVERYSQSVRLDFRSRSEDNVSWIAEMALRRLTSGRLMNVTGPVALIDRDTVGDVYRSIWTVEIRI